MRINDENLLKEMRMNVDKSQRENYYKVGNLTFRQFYDHSTDVYNPYKVYIYLDNDYVIGGSSSTIEGSYNNLVTSLVEYMMKYRDERTDKMDRISKAMDILRDKDYECDCDDRL